MFASANIPNKSNQCFKNSFVYAYIFIVWKTSQSLKPTQNTAFCLLIYLWNGQEQEKENGHCSIVMQPSVSPSSFLSSFFPHPFPFTFLFYCSSFIIPCFLLSSSVLSSLVFHYLFPHFFLFFFFLPLFPCLFFFSFFICFKLFTFHL